MKRIISLLLIVVMVCSLGITAFATTDYNNGTQVQYNGELDNDGDGQPDATEYYTVTVPALLAPGESGDVLAQGTWASNRKLVVDADDTVTLTNSINANDQKVLDVSFAGIELAGSNTVAVSDTKPVSVADIEDALFGTWSGKFYYNVEMKNAEPKPIFSMMHKPTGSVTKPAESETFSIYGFDVREGTSSSSEDINYTANTYYVSAEAFGLNILGDKDITADFYGEQSTFKLSKSLIGLTAEELGEYTLIVDWGDYETWVDFKIKTWEMPDGSTLDIPSICYAYKYGPDDEVIFDDEWYIPLYAINETTNTFYLTTTNTVVTENMKLFVDGHGVLSDYLISAIQ